MEHTNYAHNTHGWCAPVRLERLGTCNHAYYAHGWLGESSDLLTPRSQALISPGNVGAKSSGLRDMNVRRALRQSAVLVLVNSSDH